MKREEARHQLIYRLHQIRLQSFISSDKQALSEAIAALSPCGGREPLAVVQGLRDKRGTIWLEQLARPELQIGYKRRVAAEPVRVIILPAEGTA